MTHYSKRLDNQVLEATPVDKPTTAAAIHRALGFGARSTVRGVLIGLAKEHKVERLIEFSHHHSTAHYWRTDGWSK